MTAVYLGSNKCTLISGGTQITVCEGRQRIITCPAEQVITIVAAEYGRTERDTCPGSVYTLSCSLGSGMIHSKLRLN